MYTIIKHVNLVIGVSQLAMAAAIMHSGNGTPIAIINNIFMGIMNVLIWLLLVDIEWWKEWSKFKDKVLSTQVDCIAELAVKLIPHIGQKEVLKILERYGVEINDLWDDFDKRGRRKRKTVLKEIPSWVKEIRDKLVEQTKPQEAYALRGIHGSKSTQASSGVTPV